MRSFSACLVFLATLACVPTAFGQDDPNVKLMKELYTKIALNLGVGSNAAVQGQSYLVLANPGILLDPTLDYTSPEGRYRLSTTIDKVLKPDWIYKTGSNGTFEVYNNILNYHEAAVVNPTSTQKAQYLKACRLIFTDCDQKLPGTYTDAYNRYTDLTNKLASAAAIAEDYQRINSTAYLPPDIKNNLRVATQDLNLLGNKVAIEGALATINTYEHIDPNAWWGEVQGKLLNNALTYSGNTYGNYTIYPAYTVWTDLNTTWSKMTLSQSDLERTTSNSTTTVGGGLSGGFGLWSFGADYTNTTNRSYYKLDVSGLTVSMELMRVVLDRPWMDDAVFSSRAWKWLKASPYDGQFVSDGGDATNGITPQGIMPFVQTGLLLARRVSLSGSWSSDLETSFNSHTTGGASVGWGPFSFGGRYDNTQSNTYTKAKAAGNTIAWDAPQIIGVFVEVLPKDPNPNPCYHFASDTQSLPASCSGAVTAKSIISHNATMGRSASLIKHGKALLAKASQASSPQ
jgi:hypothetical protein